MKKFDTQGVTLVKLGGAAMQDQELVSSICANLALLRSIGVPLIVVHGGGPLINQELERRGIQWAFLDGQRITTPEMMDVVESVLCGTVNQTIVRSLGQRGARAVGIAGTDAHTLLCTQADPRLGRVGTVRKVNTTLIRSALRASMIPVIAPVGVTADGEACNVNADWAATRIAQAMSVKKLVYLTDQEGILDENLEPIGEINALGLERLIDQQVVKGGMLTKTRTILSALARTVEEVCVVNARRPGALFNIIVSNLPEGTICRRVNRRESAKEVATCEHSRRNIS